MHKIGYANKAEKKQSLMGSISSFIQPPFIDRWLSVAVSQARSQAELLRNTL